MNITGKRKKLFIYTHNVSLCSNAFQFDEDSNEACSKDTSSHVNLNGLGNSKVNEKVEFNASQNKFEAALNKVQQTEEQEFKDKEDDFKATLAEIQRQKKQAYKKHRKSLGLPTSSDEEDAVNKLVNIYLNRFLQISVL